MKAASKPFTSKYDSGRCPICQRRISKDALIQRLETTYSWTEEGQNKYGKAYLKMCYADYVHAKCLEERNADDNNG